MRFSYEEFDLSGRPDVSAGIAPEQDARRRLRAAAAGSGPVARVRRLAARHPRRRGPQSRGACPGRRAPRATRGIVWGLGAHVIKTGLGPVLIDLMERGFVSAIATNGAGVIHDFEIALVGATSEDVDEALGPGRFGMAEETGRLLNDAINEGVAARSRDSARRSRGSWRRGSRSSRAAACWRRPRASRFRSRCTSRSAPTSSTCIRRRRARRSAKAACATSATSSSNVARLERGVYLNCGSAVVLPEVFLKAVALARNRGIALAELTTVNLDFIRQYRAQTNVVARPTAGSGRGYSLVGHHEIMIPLMAAALRDGD